MSSRSRLIEHAKSVILVVLFIATILLLYLLWGKDYLRPAAVTVLRGQAAEVNESLLVVPDYVAYGSGDGSFSLADDPADPPAFWKVHGGARTCEAGAPVTVSMTLENRGYARIAGRYRFRVEPAGAARIEGPRTLDFDLRPDGRAGWEARLVPTGRVPAFRLVATVSARDQPGADLRFEIARG